MLAVIKGLILRAVMVVIYGVEGIGKSTLASYAPNPVYIDLEDGTAQLDVARLDPPKDWEDLLRIVREVKETPGICETLVIDTADRAELLAVEYICHKHKQDNIEGWGYGKGYVILQDEYKKLLDELEAVKKAGINVIMLAHAKMRKQELPDEAGAFDRWELKLTRQVSPMVKEWCDALLFANYKTFVVSTDTKAKKATGGRRVIYTSHHPCWDAKNRIGLPDEMDMTYESIAPLFLNRAKKQEEASDKESALTRFLSLMADAAVSETEVQKVVAEKGHYPADTPISQYDDKFLKGWLIAHWDKILPIIASNRSQESAEADRKE